MENPLKGRSIITSYLGGGWFFVFFLMIRDGNYGGGGQGGGVLVELRNVTQEKKLRFSLIYNLFFHECCRDFKNLFKFVHCQLTLRWFFWLTLPKQPLHSYMFLYLPKNVLRKRVGLFLYHYVTQRGSFINQSVMEGLVGSKQAILAWRNN